MQHSRQISGQQHRRTVGITCSPGSVAQVIDVVAALAAESEAHFLPQPVFIQGLRRTVDYFDGHLATIRTPAGPAAPTITPDLRPVLQAMGAEHLHWTRTRR